MKRLSLIFFLFLVPFIVKAYDFEQNGFFFKIISLSEKTVEITSFEDDRANCNVIYSDYEGDVVLPESATFENEEYSVVSIGCYAFMNRTQITSIVIPNTVETIRLGAFRGCSGIQSVYIPSNVLEIEDHVYYDCIALKEVYFEDATSTLKIGQGYGTNTGMFTINKVKKAYIGRNLQHSIYEGTFRYNDSIEEVTFGNCVTEVSYGCFTGCNNLTKIKFGNNIKTIKDFAFANCNSIEDLCLPPLLSNIQESAFSNTFSLKNIYALNVNPQDISENAFETKVYLSANLYVPENSLSEYSTRVGWKNFRNMEEFDVSNIASTKVGISNNEIFTIWGVKVKELKKNGIYIINGKKSLYSH